MFLCKIVKPCFKNEKKFSKTKKNKKKKRKVITWDVNVDSIVVSKLLETKTNSKYVIEIKFDKTIRQLVVIIPKMSGYVKTFKVEDKVNKLMSFHIDG